MKQESFPIGSIEYRVHEGEIDSPEGNQYSGPVEIEDDQAAVDAWYRAHEGDNNA